MRSVHIKKSRFLAFLLKWERLETWGPRSQTEAKTGHPLPAGHGFCFVPGPAWSALLFGCLFSSCGYLSVLIWRTGSTFIQSPLNISSNQALEKVDSRSFSWQMPQCHLCYQLSTEPSASTIVGQR